MKKSKLPDEGKRIHDKAVSLRKLGDAQLVAAVRNNAADRSRIASLEQENQELMRRVEAAEKGEAANARLTVQALKDLDEKKAELAKAEAKVEDLKERLAKAEAKVEDLKERLAEACKALDESEEKAEKTTMVSSVPPEPKIDVRGGIWKWLVAYVSTTKGIGNATFSKLDRILDGTSDADLNKMFREEQEKAW